MSESRRKLARRVRARGLRAPEARETTETTDSRATSDPAHARDTTDVRDATDTASAPVADRPTSEAERPVAPLTHHVLVCTGSACGRATGRKALKRLRRRAADLAEHGRRVQGTEVACLKLCVAGPIAVVYPDGTWYAGVTPAVMDRICDTQLIGGQPLTTHCVADHPLPLVPPPLPTP